MLLASSRTRKCCHGSITQAVYPLIQNVPMWSAGTVVRAVFLLHLTCVSTATCQACADGGEASMQAMEQLREAGFTEAVRVEGGYEAWTQVGCCWVTSGELVAAISNAVPCRAVPCGTPHGDSLSFPLLELTGQHGYREAFTYTTAPCDKPH